MTLEEVKEAIKATETVYNFLDKNSAYWGESWEDTDGDYIVADMGYVYEFLAHEFPNYLEEKKAKLEREVKV